MSPHKKFLFSLVLIAAFAGCSTDTVSVHDEDDYSSSSAGEISSSSAEESSASRLSSSSLSSSSSFEISSSSAEISSSSGKILTEELLAAIQESGAYTTRDSVAAYLCKFEKLPSNYRTKSEAQILYESTGKTFSKWNFNPWTTLGVMVGGDSFSNREGLLPDGSYKECDVEYSLANRGTKRLVYAESCTIYYTADHYESFTKIE